MSQRGSLMTVGLVALLLISIITTATTIYFYQESVSANQKFNEYYQKFQNAQQNYTSIRESVIKVNVRIDYGNGTVTTNDAYLAPKTTVFDALKTVAGVNATYWQEYQSWLIDAINNVVSNENDNNRWWVFSVNGEHALVSADAYELRDGDNIEWTYEQY